MGSNGRQGADGSIAGASGSGSGGQNVRTNVVGKRRPNGPAVNRRVFGNMMGGNNPEDDEGSLDSDSDLILDGENDSEDSDEDDEELEVNEMAAETLKARKSARAALRGNPAVGNGHAQPPQAVGPP